MVRKGIVSKKDYISYIYHLVHEVAMSNKEVYLLNHGGKDDEAFIYACKDILGGKVEIVTNLNALETKGLIASSYLVISSRFHGVASALNSCVPCLATSWSHKYQCLFDDFHQKNCILSVTDKDADYMRIREFMDPQNNKEIREGLKAQIQLIKSETQKMWSEVWSL